MMDKYQMLNEIIAQLDRLADARGAERCAILVDLVQRASALKKGLREEQDAADARIESLKAQIKNLTDPAPLPEGETRIGGEVISLDFGPKIESAEKE